MVKEDLLLTEETRGHYCRQIKPPRRNSFYEKHELIDTVKEICDEKEPKYKICFFKEENTEIFGLRILNDFIKKKIKLEPFEFSYN